MIQSQTDVLEQRKPLRLWPGATLGLLVLLLRFVIPALWPATLMVGMIGGLAGALAIVVWWAFFSRASGIERFGGVVLMVGAVVATLWVSPQLHILHRSIATGMMGMMFPLYAVPTVSIAFVAWAALTRRLADGPRRAAMVATVLLACGGFGLVRTYGITGGGDSDFAWRWSKTPEERLLAEADAEPSPLSPTTDLENTGPAERGAEWPGFRGPHRDSVVRGVRISTDWSASPPIELWRRPIGPGWSSFAVAGDRLYTQEQRGEEEVVSSYDAATGEPVWMHSDPVRFWESNAGAGPRGTPTLSGDRLYSFGATGILNALDAGTGAVVWSRDVVADTDVATPGWGFASSPLVLDDLVLVAASGELVAYDLVSGEPRWQSEDNGESYSSPQLLTLDGVRQVLLQGGRGTRSVAPADGSLLWEYAWPGFSSLQPALTASGDLLISISGSGGGSGTRRVAVAHGADGWSVDQRWESRGLKPYFNDFVVDGDHAFGFDGRILSCIDLEGGERRWKGGRYGNGQLLLLADQDVLLVVSERGELALVQATPERFNELARFPAIEGKTWNHPALVGNLLLVRNGREMAAFRLSLES